jgi:hypothetical protein
MISINELLNESQDRIYLLSGVLITDGAVRNQKDILSDIRSLPAVTVVRSIEMEEDLTSKYDRSKIEVKIDPYPYLKQNKFSGETTVNKIADDIKKIPGVIGFKNSNNITTSDV